MALLFLGKSTCTICKEVLNDSENIYMFIHFVPDNHLLWKYSDSCVHKNCFNEWEHKKEFLALYESITGESYFE